MFTGLETVDLGRSPTCPYQIEEMVAFTYQFNPTFMINGVRQGYTGGHNFRQSGAFPHAIQI